MVPPGPRRGMARRPPTPHGVHETNRATPLLTYDNGGVVQAEGDAVEQLVELVGVRNVVFDLDGTLIDSRPGIVAGIRHALARLGHNLPDGQPLDWAIGPPAEIMSRLLAPLGDDR